MRLILACLVACLCFGQTTLVDRVGTTGFLQLEAPSFPAQTPNEQALGYWLTQASIAIEPIIYDSTAAAYGNTYYVSSQQTGIWAATATTLQLESMFQQIAASLLRISQ